MKLSIIMLAGIAMSVIAAPIEAIAESDKRDSPATSVPPGSDLSDYGNDTSAMHRVVYDLT